MHKYANPAQFLKIAKPATFWLFWPGMILTLASCLWGVTMVPEERLMGKMVSIIFVHVPSAWLSMAGWTSIAIASIVQLVWRHPLAGISARAIAVPGAVFAAICLVTGSIWGRPAWGAWWVWDGRLTSMLVLFLIYIAYISLVSSSSNKGETSRFAAIFGIFGAVNIPIINRSVIWWESQHQKPSITLGGSSIDAAYLYPLYGAILGFSLIFGAVVLMRMRSILAQIKVENRMRRRAEG
ncbi:heme ABC transporter permease [Sphingorhabdus lutea]|uniref:Heme exporter protein C n=1 Tax=Sphingorhabdus lutea TaxID=1913578 RepID=A0A1L3JCS0_9SPHN|nr:heme ABC transporter permease [Sphingorhabdus lutea]